MFNFKNLDNYLLYSEPDGQYAGPIIASPLCIHFARFDIYRNWDFTKILVFEAFITYSHMYGNRFFRIQEKMIEDLRITKYTLLKTVKSLIDDGYITKAQSGEDENFKNFYTVDFDKIIKDINQIYNFEVFEANASQGVRELYISKYKVYKDRAIKHDRRFPKYH